MVIRVPKEAGRDVLTDIKHIVRRHRGGEELTVTTGGRRLRLGRCWKVNDTPELRAELEEFGEIVGEARP